MEFCSSPEWRAMLEEQILPPVLRDLDLGDDVIEIGPGPGFTTDVLRRRAAHVTAVEIDEVLAERLSSRWQPKDHWNLLIGGTGNSINTGGYRRNGWRPGSVPRDQRSDVAVLRALQPAAAPRPASQIHGSTGNAFNYPVRLFSQGS